MLSTSLCLTKCFTSFSSIDCLLYLLCTIFDAILSNINEILSINPYVKVCVFSVHYKDWLTYSGRKDRLVNCVIIVRGNHAFFMIKKLKLIKIKLKQKWPWQENFLELRKFKRLCKKQLTKLRSNVLAASSLKS